MLKETNKPETIDEYIAGFPKDVQAMMEQLRATIIASAPEAKEIISYMMPCFVLKGNLVYFAAYKNHIGFYPGAAVIERFKDEVSQYKWAKGSVQFPLTKPMPLDLIKIIVEFRVAQNLEKAEAKKLKKK